MCPGRTKPFWCAWFKRDCDPWGRADARLCSAFLGAEAEGRSDTAGKWKGEVRICKGIETAGEGWWGLPCLPRQKPVKMGGSKCKSHQREQGCSAKLCSLLSKKLSRFQKGVGRLPALRALGLPTQGFGCGPTSALRDLGRNHGVARRVLAFPAAIGEVQCAARRVLVLI